MKRQILAVVFIFATALIILLGFKNKSQPAPSDYIILMAEGPRALEKDVKRHFDLDYECIGGVAIYKADSSTTYFVQAMHFNK